jgi:predicted nucleic acid-binding protein
MSNAQFMGINSQEWSSDHERVYGLEKDAGTTAVEKEEYRRTLWLLFIQDRNHAWPTAWPHIIPETHFKVHIPIADSIFQAMDPEVRSAQYVNKPFTRSLSRLVTNLSSAKEPTNVFQYICIAHVLLGRVSEVVHSLHDASDSVEYAEECEELDLHIVKFRLSLPRHATSVLEAAPTDRAHVVWLQVILNTCAMLLNFNCAKDNSINETSSQFLCAVAAAHNTAQIVKEASRVSVDLLLSPHIASSLYVAACILAIQWRTTEDASFRKELDIFELVFDRMDESFVFLGLKFKIALAHDLNRSRENLEQLRDRGFRGLLADCTKWAHVKQEVQRRGLPIDIT